MSSDLPHYHCANVKNSIFENEDTLHNMKQRRRKKNKSPKQSNPNAHVRSTAPNVAPNENVSKVSKIKALASRWYVWVGVLVTFATIPTLWDYFNDKYFKSDHEKFIEVKRITPFTSDILSDYKLNEDMYIHLGTSPGTFIGMDINKFLRGEAYHPRFVTCVEEKETALDLSFRLSGNKILFSTTLRDYQTGNIICVIKDSQSEGVINELYDYYSNDHLFEVLDNRRHVVLSVEYKYPNSFYVKGYFVHTGTVAVINDNGVFIPCLPNVTAEDKQKIKELVDEITPLGTYEKAPMPHNSTHWWEYLIKYLQPLMVFRA